jgi:outer membrane receptor protein involved in Fe transport
MPHHAFRWFILCLVPAALTFGQQTKAPSDASSAKDEAVTLSPFTVSTEKDTGYMAADVLSSGMMPITLLRSPGDTTVLTRDFLDDLGAIDSMSVQQWLTSTDVINVQGQGTNPTDFGTSTTFRGVGGGHTRNYFKSAHTPEIYVTERIEGARGPNGILYGDASQGGKTNFVTKRPTFTHNFGSVKLLLDGYTTQNKVGMGAYLDINHVFNPQWAARINVQKKAGPQWYDRSFDKHHGANATVTYRPWRGAAVTLEVEKDLVAATTYRPDAYFDALSLWDRTTTVNAPLTAAPAASTGLNRLTAHTWVYIAGIGTMDWQNMGLTTGTGISTLPNSLEGGRDKLRNFPVKPSKTFNMQSPLEKVESHEANYSISATQTLGGGLTIEAAADHSQRVSEGDTLYFTNAYLDPNRVLPDGRPNPNFGKIFTQSTAGWNPIRTGDYYSAARLAIGYPIKWKMFNQNFSQSFSIVGSWREEVHPFKAWQYYQDNGLIAPAGLTGSGADGNQVVKIWRYWDAPDAPAELPLGEGTRKYRYIMSRDQHNTAHLTSVLAGAMGSYFDDKLLLVAGIRRDRYHPAARDIQRRDPVTGDPTLLGPANGVFLDSFVNTPQVGLTYFPIKQVGVYANRSNGFNPSIQNVPKLDGSGPYNLAVSRGKSGGLRFNLFDSKLVGTVGYYDSFEAGAPSNQALSQINGIWDAIANSGRPGAPTNQRIAQTGGLAQYSDQLTRRQWGWEAEATANLTRGLRFTANVALPHTKQLNSLPDTKNYYAENLSLWNQFRSVATVNTAMTNLENVLSGTADGRPLNGLYRYRANAYGNYQFQHGPLKGLTVGAGANFFGQQIIGNPTGAPFTFFYADAYYLVTATLGYKFTYREHPVALNLAVSNLLNYDEPIYRQGGVSVYSGNYYYSQYYWPTPPEARLTATVKF